MDCIDVCRENCLQLLVDSDLWHTRRQYRFNLSATTLVIIYGWIWLKRAGIHLDLLFYVKAMITIGFMYVIVVLGAQLFSIHATRLFLIVPTILLSFIGVMMVLIMTWAMKLFPKSLLQNILKRSR